MCLWLVTSLFYWNPLKPSLKPNKPSATRPYKSRRQTPSLALSVTFLAISHLPLSVLCWKQVMFEIILAPYGVDFGLLSWDSPAAKCACDYGVWPQWWGCKRTNDQRIMQLQPVLCKCFGGGRHERHGDYRRSSLDLSGIVKSQWVRWKWTTDLVEWKCHDTTPVKIIRFILKKKIKFVDILLNHLKIPVWWCCHALITEYILPTYFWFFINVVFICNQINRKG